MYSSVIRSTAILLLIGIIVGCAPTSNPVVPSVAEELVELDITNELNELPDLSISEQLESALALTPHLNAANSQSFDTFLIEWQSTFLNNTDQSRLVFIQAAIANAQGRHADSAAFYNTAALRPAIQLTNAVAIDINQRSAISFELVGQYYNAAYAVFVQCSLSPSNECDQRIIQLLLEEEVQVIEESKTESTSWNKWITLTLLLADSRTSLDKQGEALTSFIEVNPDLFFNDTPELISQLIELSMLPPPRTAVLLPLSGPLSAFGSAIQDGIILSHYNMSAAGGRVSSIDFYDSNNDDFIALYLDVADRYDLIIGPLLKDRVAQIAALEQVTTTPTLLLNSYDLVSDNEQLFSFSLNSSEDGAEVARMIYNRGYRQPLVLLPAGKNNDEIKHSFESAWLDQLSDESSPHTVELALARLTVGSQFATEIASALHVDKSRARARAISRALQLPVESEDRRRQDIDSIFISGTPIEARQIKPQIDFNHGNDLDVFASSRVYSGEANQTRNQDLNGVFVSVAPWSVFHEDGSNALIFSSAEGQPALQALMALGADSMIVGTRLNYLHLVPGTRLPGYTGKLSVSEDRSVSRRLSWGVYQNGALIPLADGEK
ncbi:penicillin-binding protein activator [uncultured Umboniibacter sp.]|uniref:penicillin-binding protein activator n=1 Tax=uncultured Umboniibacter sp. TaxID=1798917 RepID=UPI00263199D9|nr:penicillin-binding protein activator [uncultured Umboniibacter sp.]